MAVVVGGCHLLRCYPVIPLTKVFRPSDHIVFTWTKSVNNMRNGVGNVTKKRFGMTMRGKRNNTISTSNLNSRISSAKWNQSKHARVS